MAALTHACGQNIILVGACDRGVCLSPADKKRREMRGLEARQNF